MASIPATPQHNASKEKNNSQQNLVEKTVWFTVDRHSLVKVKLSKYLSTDREFYANSGLIKKCQLPHMERQKARQTWDTTS